MIIRSSFWLIAAVAAIQLADLSRAFQVRPSGEFRNRRPSTTNLKGQQVDVSQEKILEASEILSEWDRQYNPETRDKMGADAEKLLAKLPDAVRVLNTKATEERAADPSMGRCMLGICASSINEGIATLKSWVTTLELPRGLLHGADKDGVPLEFPGGVYIKYNSGGVYTFADIRKSQMGFDALWKPGDAMLEDYDGTVRGIYFQVELSDGEFRQYLLPLDLMGDL